MGLVPAEAAVGQVVCLGLDLGKGSNVLLPLSIFALQGATHTLIHTYTFLLPSSGRVEVAGAQLSWLGGNELQCLKVYDSPRGGQILLHLNKVSTSSSLWQLLAGEGSWGRPRTGGAWEPLRRQPLPSALAHLLTLNGCLHAPLSARLSARLSACLSARLLPLLSVVQPIAVGTLLCRQQQLQPGDQQALDQRNL